MRSPASRRGVAPENREVNEHPAGGGARVLLFLARGFEDLEAAAVMAVCGWTSYRDHLPSVEVTTTGLDRPVRGRFGLEIRPDLSLSEVDASEYDAIAIPGGFRSHGWEEQACDARVYDLLRAIHGQGGTIATMCVGVLPVAEAGLLRGRRATTYPHSRTDNLARLRSLGAIVVDERVTVDDRVISCAGPAQAIQVGLALVDAVAGSAAAAEVKRYMIGE